MKTIVTKLSYKNTAERLREGYARLAVGGSFFAFFSTEYDADGNVRHDFFELIHEAVQIGYDYVNTIVFPTERRQQAAFTDNVRYVVWLCKNHAALVFDKDVIREKHIWKDVEWGKRAKNYNPKGKDPGNVWIPTLDDGQANITDHILLTEEEVLQKVLRMTLCGEDCELFGEDLECASVKAPVLDRKARAGQRTAKVVFGTSEDMKETDSASVTTAVTSPPYWNLKDYFKEGQIGQEPYENYLARMKTVWAQCYEKLEERGSLWININIRVKEGKVILIPYDIVKMCRELGFYYKGILIWHKSSGIPTGEKNIVDRHEYVLLFSKARSYAVDREIFSGYGDYKNDRINGGAFWNINRKAGSVGKKFIHPAIYPNALVERIIAVSSPENALVLDPFLGSGTSLIAAARENRSFIGYEYNEGFRALMESRFQAEIPGTEVEFR